MIKATNKNSPYCAEIDFPCTETEQPENIFQKEITRKLCNEGYTVTNDGNWLTVMLNGTPVVKISDKDILYTDGNFYDKDKAGVFPLSQIVREIYDYCTAYEKSAPLKAEHLSGNYRCLAEFNGTVLAAKYSEQNEFEFVTWDRTYDGKGVCQGNYHSDYFAAKEDFAVRSGLVDKDRLFSDDELLKIKHCVDFTLENDNNFDFAEENELSELKKRVERLSPSSLNNLEQSFSEQTM